MLTDKTIGELVNENFKTARVFEKYQIDYCCGGKRKLSEISLDHNLDMDSLIRELTELRTEKAPESGIFDLLTLPELIDHITGHHHAYIRKQGPVLEARLDKLVSVHGRNHPELLEIRSLFGRHNGALAQHLMKEELILFPYIKAMDANRREGGPKPAALFGTVRNPVGMMELEHSEVGEELKELSRLTNQYTCPPDGCTTYRTTWQELKDWESDLHLHVHLENNLLHPKALDLEASWAG
ncbi:MAG: iron-sulfur cluster repair di-iron protein [Bacteroidetes bacterium]|nr:iron-sulfur cluster repair di-iron protein [Bacteroidota bacterium]